MFQTAPGGRALRQDPMKEVQLSQVRNKALAKLGLGLEQESPIAKPWQSVFKPWFASPETEHDYREAAYALHRRFLVRLLIHGGIMYAFVAVLWALFVSLGLAWSVGQNGSCGAICGPRGATVVMRFLGAAGQFAVAIIVVCSSLGPRAIGITVFCLVYLLAAVPLADLARGGSQDEPAELMLVYLIVYRILVPIFQIRHGNLLRPLVQAQRCTLILVTCACAWHTQPVVAAVATSPSPTLWCVCLAFCLSRRGDVGADARSACDYAQHL